MSWIAELLLIVGGLLMLVAVIESLADWSGLPEATLLALAGVAVSVAYMVGASVWPLGDHPVFQMLGVSYLPADACLLLVLPPLLFQLALEVDVDSLQRDAAPILLLAIVDVFVATGVIGAALAQVSGHGLVICLLAGTALISLTHSWAVCWWAPSDLMFSAARSEGVAGYRWAARKILDIPFGLRIGLLLQRYASFDGLLRAALTDRFELLICRRAVLHRSQRYNRTRLAPILGSALAEELDRVLEARVELNEAALEKLRSQYEHFTVKLERRLLLLFALRRGKSLIGTMAEEHVISAEATIAARQKLESIRRAAILRPSLQSAERDGASWHTAPLNPPEL